MIRRWLIVMLVICVTLSMTGCSFLNFDMDTTLRAPHAAGEQDAIQTALEEHIHQLESSVLSEESAIPAYVLKYPKMGSYRSAFIMKDIDGDDKEDALAFYATAPDGANTHIVMLSKQNGQWVCMDDIEGLATEIERVNFGDLNNDGVMELFTGFSMYDTRDRRLMLYTWEDGHFVERYSDTYTNMIVASVVQEGRDDFLLYRIQAAEEKTTVRLLSMEEDTIVEKSSASLDGKIQQFLDYSFAELPSGGRALYQDCLKTSGTLVTELIVWDGDHLEAPLYDPLENITTHSARESSLPVGDIDFDGELEWPQSFRMPGDELTAASEVLLWMSDWYAWNDETDQPVKKLTNIVNTADQYYLKVPDEWIGNITARYAPSQRSLSILEVTDGKIGDELIRLVAIPQGDDNPFGSGGYAYLDATDKLRYEIQYDKASDMALSMELLSSLFVMYPGNN